MGMTDEEDPKPADRIWYRHSLEGTRGYLVTRDGQKHIKLDNPHQEIVRPFVQSHWVPERENRPCTRAAIAKVAFETDKALCMALGEHVLARRDWNNLKDEERIEWMAGHKNPPKAVLRDAERAGMYVLVMKRLERIATE